MAEQGKGGDGGCEAWRCVRIVRGCLGRTKVRSGWERRVVARVFGFGALRFVEAASRGVCSYCSRLKYLLAAKENVRTGCCLPVGVSDVVFRIFVGPEKRGRRPGADGQRLPCLHPCKFDHASHSLMFQGGSPACASQSLHQMKVPQRH